MPKSICLVAIVKDEAQYIEKMLCSALPYCSDAVICDTGSKDDTIGIAERVTEDLLGLDTAFRVHRDKWVNFSHNRNLAIERAEQSGCEWMLLMDGDEELVVREPSGNSPDNAWAFNMKHGEFFHWHVPRLVRMKMDGVVRKWRYVGACHEYIFSDGIKMWDQPRLNGVFIRHLEDGSRSSDKLKRNLDLLLSEAESPADPVRHSFYLANTQFALGLYEDALASYTKRAAMNETWAEEVFYSKYRIGMCHERSGRVDAAFLSFLDAWNYRPSRVEPLSRAASIAIGKRQFNLAHSLTSVGIRIPAADDSLFVDSMVWDWDIPIQHGIACLATGRNKEAVQVLSPLIGKPGPEDVRAGARQNFELALSRLN